MPSTPYKPVSWNGEAVSNAKLNQMANNDQWLFENAARVRYIGDGIPRDMGVKVLAGKTPYGTATIQHVYIDVYFGSFFSANCKPAITGLVETTGLGRKELTIHGLGGEADHRGFRAAIYTYEVTNIESGGWLHWHAIGY